MQNITGSFISATARYNNSATGAFTVSSTFWSSDWIGADGGEVLHSTYDLNSSRVVRTGNVTHGKQIGVKYIIKVL